MLATAVMRNVNVALIHKGPQLYLMSIYTDQDSLIQHPKNHDSKEEMML